MLEYVILVPIVGWLLVYHNTFAQLVSELFGLDAALSLSWEVLLFYLGLVLLGIAASVFRIFGPEAVLDHHGLQGYAEDTEAILTRKEFALLCDTIGWTQSKEVNVPAAGTGQVLDFTLKQWKCLNCESIRDVLSDHYRSEKMKSSGWRIFTSIAFIIGALFTLIPTATTVVWAIGQILAVSEQVVQISLV